MAVPAASLAPAPVAPSHLERLRAIEPRRLLVLDTETTGLDGDARVVELVVLDWRGRALIDTLIDPGVPIPPEATAVHGIADGDVRGAPTLARVWPTLAGLLRGGDLVATAYNAAYDSRVLGREAALLGLPALAGDWPCAMRAWGQHAGLRRWARLEAACAAAGVAHEGKHRAIGDARATLALIGVMRGG